MLILPMLHSPYVTAAGGITDPSADDPSIYGWYDASDGTSVTTSGTDVTSIADLIGAEDLTAENSPQYNPGVIQQNGLDVIRCTSGGAGTQCLRHFLWADPTGDFVVHGAVSIASVDDFNDGIMGLQGTDKIEILAGSGTQFDGFIAGNNLTTSALTGGPYSGIITFSLVLDYTNNLWEAFINGVSRGSAANTGTSNISDLVWGANATRNRKTDWDLCELIITESMDLQTEYHDYLAAKWIP